jgi:hypothetical protein
MAATPLIRLTCPAGSRLASSLYSALRKAAGPAGVNVSFDECERTAGTRTPYLIRGTAQTVEGLVKLLGAIHRWAFDVRPRITVDFTLELGGKTVFETARLAIGGKAIAVAAQSLCDTVSLLDAAGVLQVSDRVLIDLDADRNEAVADVGKRAAYVVDLNTRLVHRVPGAGDVPEPR